MVHDVHLISILYSHLCSNKFNKLEDIPCKSIVGACMLADISGFSKFSAEMCKKGLAGKFKSSDFLYYNHYNHLIVIIMHQKV